MNAATVRRVRRLARRRTLEVLALRRADAAGRVGQNAAAPDRPAASPPGPAAPPRR